MPENREFIESLVDVVKKPVLIEMWDERFFYFVLKFEFNFADTLDKASALSTVQIDVENAERYDMTYVDEAGERQRPYCCTARPPEPVEGHVRPPGEGSASGGEGKLPMLQTRARQPRLGHSRG